MANGYIELTLTNNRGPICFPIGGFAFALHMEGGAVVHSGGQTFHVDESYEYIVETLLANTYIARAPDEADEDAVEKHITKIKASLDNLYQD
jgi:hypothetical protein